MESPSSIDPQEIAKFALLADEWWNPNGPFAPLHRFNPLRLNFIRDMAAEHFGRDVRARHPFEALSLLDLGCGGGLLSEPMARLGFAVTGCDAAEENVRAARVHAAGGGIVVDYRCGTAESLAEEGVSFDLVLAMEIVEHVADTGAFIETAARLLRPGGLMFVATINKTLKSLALAKIGAEYVLRWLPRGTHDWNRFLSPGSLGRMIEDQSLTVLRTAGMNFDPFTWQWRLSRDADVNYVVVASRPHLPVYRPAAAPT
ncbi:MAG TPA: bifunctional 2-polyprenyl-6-hydroxyphenol methylase/3-demethylubiquinol 3-O-methyltransferase UbiG [Rhizomicrobium sp.]